MSISFELSDISDPELRKAIEAVIQNCIGESARDGDWKIWIQAVPEFTKVRIEGPAQARERFFLGNLADLPDKIREWIEAYPFRPANRG